ncbi:cytochrome P450/oxidoreductase [Halomonas sp. HAL1]|uniref:cytochrome P450/oxidoreductase n=1 Tax=Halomonas sp. HAL1 TaxID=550984 RepID=UPI00022D309E|nr:cytochrome P450/oxidoreductase [Halomonas sp. HAL1]EHA16430.1 cytochrome p450 monooxygenase [Halomonas sp. HAL1]WKV92733.1 cytochrome P450/oxidoreductase [Halomonas sp. HAL1]
MTSTTEYLPPGASGCPFHQAAVSPTGCPVSPGAADFDPFDAPYQLDPAEALRWSREEEPVFYSPKLGYWVVSRFDDVKAVFRDNHTFSPSIALEKLTPAPPAATKILDSYGFAMRRTMVNEDEPDHMERRRLLMDAFLPENLEKHEVWVRELVRDYMNRFIDKGRADLVGEMFREIPMTVALRFLGVPNEDAQELRKFSVAHTLNTWGRPSPEQQLQIAEDVGQFWKTAQGILDRMRADPTGEGWMYDSIRMHEVSPDIVPESYLRSMMMAILVAAHETTAFATTNAFRTLLSNRDSWNDICENPALIPSAIEECLRAAGSVVAWRRLATVDTEVGGEKIPKGGKLLIVQASANRDPRHFENPDEFDIYRHNAAEHLTFGYGAHQCMGKNIARLEMRVILDEFIRRLPHIHLVEEQAFEYLPNTSFRGPTSLWVEWEPAQNPERRTRSVLENPTHFHIGAPIKDDILRRVVVTGVKREAEAVIRIDLADPHGRELPDWSPGSHIELVSGDWRRCYSLCGTRDDPSRLSIAILREPEGRGGSLHFHDTVKPGDVLHIAGPKNHFHLDETATRYTLIAGGIGITPILAMADHLKALGKPYALHYCGAGRRTMGFLERVERDHAAALTVHAGDEGCRLDLPVVLSGLSAGEQVYSCGPERMLEVLEALAVNWPEGTLHIEHFSARPSILDPENEHGFEAVLADSDLTVQVGNDQTLLEALTAAGVDVPSDCCEGLCGTCEVAVAEGHIDHRDLVLSLVERDANNRMMVCCSRAKGKRLVLSL